MAGTAKSEKRADYASTKERELGAWIKSVEEGSPAWEAGLEPGMRIETVNGKPLRDIIDWRWEASDDVAELTVFTPDDGQVYDCELLREPGQEWGVEFTDVLFDGIRTCVNACQFCFMRMLPEDARSSLLLRDDDYRLSFTQGNFVTLTNMTDEDVDRVITCRLEPMNVSIHAVSPEVRRKLIGPHAQRGMDVLERLCAAGIEVHGQVVLCAGINDGEELHRTLEWVEAHDTVTSIAIVPMGYTKYSKNFSRSFSEDREASRAVVGLLKPYQERARQRLNMRVLRGRRPAHSRGRGLRRLPPVLRRHRNAAELPGRGARRVREPCQRAARGRGCAGRARRACARGGGRGGAEGGADLHAGMGKRVRARPCRAARAGRGHPQ